MYAWIWQNLPGPWPVKALLSTIALACVMVLCFTELFPAIAEMLPVNDGAVHE